jgi:hypothetical protein
VIFTLHVAATLICPQRAAFIGLVFSILLVEKDMRQKFETKVYKWLAFLKCS